MKDFQDQVVWVIGASSGIGEAVSKELSLRGARLVLSARRMPELERINRLMGDKHKVMCLDVSVFEDVSRTVKAIVAAEGRLDRVLFMPAVYRQGNVMDNEPMYAKHLFEINFHGAYNTIHAVMPEFLRRQSGQIAICASVAGYMGLPGGQPYSASKAALINLTESLKAETPECIDVKVINPGFVKTPLTDLNDFHMPLRIEADEAARCICEGLLSSHFEIHFPKLFTCSAKFLANLPYFIFNKINKKFLNKR